MCYSRNCKYEDYWGECHKPKGKPCPNATPIPEVDDDPDDPDEDEDDERTGS